MKAPLHILHLEDNPSDALLVQSTLEAEDIECCITRVQTHDDFVEALEQGGIDLILSDFSLPAFDGLSAAEIVSVKWPSIPLILVSGTLGEELAIDSLKSGATDYVLKERLARLAPAVRRAMQEVQERAERRRIEGQFIESQKMEVLGLLAGGVAHDFNNILAVIMGYSDLMMLELGPEHSLQKHLLEVRHAADRASALTQQLLIFSRKQKLEPAVLDFNQILTDMEKMLRRLIDENIELDITPGKQIGRLKADPNHLGQLLMNFVVNARDAMPNGGKIAIETRNVTLDEAYSRSHPQVVPGEYVMLAVTDSGSGIPDEIKSRLFEPFFTTKPAGKGTGLGLATCLTIAKQSQGHIDFQSDLGHGTTFRVYFPCVDHALAAPAQSAPVGALPRGTETLLLVEDERSVRHLAHQILEIQGYTVLRATNGEEALNVVCNHKGSPISLVVTDVIMPRMGGKVMAEWLKANYPDLKILFTSGYSDDAITHHGVLDPGIAFLPKPYSPSTLVRKVRELLDVFQTSTAA